MEIVSRDYSHIHDPSVLQSDLTTPLIIESATL